MACRCNSENNRDVLSSAVTKNATRAAVVRHKILRRGHGSDRFTHAAASEHNIISQHDVIPATHNHAHHHQQHRKPILSRRKLHRPLQRQTQHLIATTHNISESTSHRNNTQHI
eukprot:3940949-Rhodomonas_salina.2